MFPIIEHIDDLRNRVDHLPEIRFSKEAHGTTVACYMIGNNQLWNDVNADYVRECRGITFYEDGTIASRGLHKFFNINENEQTLSNKLDFGSVTRTMFKEDGSMIMPVLFGKEVLYKSKKSFTSDVALIANQYAKENPKYDKFSSTFLNKGFSPIFEFTAPNNRIVLKYDVPQLTLLHIRNTVTGKYLSQEHIETYALYFDIPYVESINNPDIHHLLCGLDTITDIEGYVFQFPNGEMVKAKSNWYLYLHRSVVFLNERNIAEMVLKETLDDFKSYLVETDNQVSLAKVNQIELEVSQRIADLVTMVTGVVEVEKHLTKKEFAIKYNDHPIFHLLIQCFDGKEPSYKDYYRKNILKEKYSLTEV
jgi:T4 RnlA family RNA ligase